VKGKNDYSYMTGLTLLTFQTGKQRLREVSDVCKSAQLGGALPELDSPAAGHFYPSSFLLFPSFLPGALVDPPVLKGQGLGRKAWVLGS
jgi:hypothetical protein